MPDTIPKPEILLHIGQSAIHGPVKVRDVIEEVCREKGETKRIASKEATRLKESVCLALDDHLQTSRSRGVQEYIQRLVEKPDTVVLCPQAGKMRWTGVVQSLLSTLSPREFEIVVAKAIVGNECGSIAVTPFTADGGFDYVGKVQQGCADTRFDREPDMFKGQFLFAFGQVKRYEISRGVAISELDYMLGVTRSIEQGGGTPVKQKMIDSLQSWGWRRNAPIKPCYATSSWYRSNVPNYACFHQLGILDGEQIAQKILNRIEEPANAREVRAALKRFAQSEIENVTFF